MRNYVTLVQAFHPRLAVGLQKLARNRAANDIFNLYLFYGICDSVFFLQFDARKPEGMPR
jgi:hypothetical protein